jgi:hypothetical protein
MLTVFVCAVGFLMGGWCYLAVPKCSRIGLKNEAVIQNPILTEYVAIAVRYFHVSVLAPFENICGDWGKCRAAISILARTESFSALEGTWDISHRNRRVDIESPGWGLSPDPHRITPSIATTEGNICCGGHSNVRHRAFEIQRLSDLDGPFHFIVLQNKDCSLRSLKVVDLTLYCGYLRTRVCSESLGGCSLSQGLISLFPSRYRETVSIVGLLGHLLQLLLIDTDEAICL